ncbi:MAG: HAD family hydrolase [Eubacteriales bacterium]|nr:HAD family hydrolase [Eubacteriales bacterium]
MKKIKCAIFDLDGTLINTIDDLADACEILLKKYGVVSNWTLDDYKNFVGNGAKKLVERAFDHKLDEKTLCSRYQEFKPLYDSIKLNHAHPYDGIKEQLDILKSKGIKLAVVTNKPNVAAVGMVEHVFGANYFDCIIGAVDGVPVKPEPDMVNKALKQLDCKPGEAIYFGDSEVDIRTGHNSNVEVVACSWGFRQFETLFSENPSVIIDEPKYISKLF